MPQIILPRMKNFPRYFFTTVLFLTLTALPSLAQNTATNPAPRDSRWVQRHEGFVKEAKAGGIDLLFMGDSITDYWRRSGPGGGSNVWSKFYGPRHAANFGISGDRTQNVLWRIENGELDGIDPKVIVLMIGTNNSNSDEAEPIAQAIRLILDQIRARCPGTKILLLAVCRRH